MIIFNEIIFKLYKQKIVLFDIQFKMFFYFKRNNNKKKLFDKIEFIEPIENSFSLSYIFCLCIIFY